MSNHNVQRVSVRSCEHPFVAWEGQERTKRGQGSKEAGRARGEVCAIAVLRTATSSARRLHSAKVVGRFPSFGSRRTTLPRYGWLDSPVLPLLCCYSLRSPCLLSRTSG